MSVPISFAVNGKDISVSVDNDETLLDTLRTRLGLRATRFGCGEEACGACMVIIDGAAAYSCTKLSVDVNAKSVLTADGLDRNGPLVTAFLDEQAGQCGYCLSGILMSASALLLTSNQPSRSDIVQALDRHLCRCGSHERIIRAVERAAAKTEQAK